MIDPCIEVVLDDDKRWLMQWKAADGTTKRRMFGSRKSLLDEMPHVLAEVRGIPFPSIQVDETITIGAPQRRAGDV